MPHVLKVPEQEARRRRLHFSGRSRTTAATKHGNFRTRRSLPAKCLITMQAVSGLVKNWQQHRHARSAARAKANSRLHAIAALHHVQLLIVAHAIADAEVVWIVLEDTWMTLLMQCYILTCALEDAGILPAVRRGRG